MVSHTGRQFGKIVWALGTYPRACVVCCSFCCLLTTVAVVVGRGPVGVLLLLLLLPPPPPRSLLPPSSLRTGTSASEELEELGDEGAPAQGNDDVLDVEQVSNHVQQVHLVLGLRVRLITCGVVLVGVVRSN